MDYKERYNRLLDAIKELQKANPSDEGIQNWINDNVPELAESEDDRIRKDLIKWIGDFPDMLWRGHYKEDVLAWLEKQGEQKPADEVETKFHVGDWILYSGDNYEGVRHITKIDEDGYWTERNGLPHGIIPFNHEICMRHWTIQDAKDGDVLACENGWTCIFKCLNDNLFSSHCFMDNEGWFCEDGGEAHTLDKRICGEIYPATKEQRDKLEKAMMDREEVVKSSIEVFT